MEKIAKPGGALCNQFMDEGPYSPPLAATAPPKAAPTKFKLSEKLSVGGSLEGNRSEMEEEEDDGVDDSCCHNSLSVSNHDQEDHQGGEAESKEHFYPNKRQRTGKNY